MHALKVVVLDGVPILEQLQYEEALLRADEGNWCLVNRNAPPAIVMGISGNLQEDLHLERVQELGMPVIKRFSGGGTVVIDENTLFVSLLGNKKVLDCPVFPEPLLCWSGEIYGRAFALPDFAVRENDYVIGDHKVGGNAQYLRKDRWLHHTTFLWDYEPERMAALKLPKRTPQYRKLRDHGDFVCRLKDHLPSQELTLKELKKALASQFLLLSAGQGELEQALRRPHRQATVQVA